MNGRRGPTSAGLGGQVVGGLARQVSDTGQIVAFRLGFSAVRALPAVTAYHVFDNIADVAYLRGGKGVDRLRANYARVRPELDRRALERLVRAGMRSYMRYYCEAFRLAGRSPESIERAFRMVGDGPVREALARGGGAVVHLGHTGNWDLAAAWSSTHLAPVTTVAERLEPEEVFRDFLAFRESLGMTILPLTGAGDPFVGLRAAIARGDFVALVADRDLTHKGVEVDLCGHRARMAKGPAVLSLLTNAPLFAASIHYEPAAGLLGGRRVVCEFSPQVHPPTEGTTADKASAMVQACADYIGAAITAHTEDWHMLQKVFVDDLDDRQPSGSTARRAR